MNRTLTLSLLGPPQILYDGRLLPPLRSSRLIVLMAYLALQKEKGAPRERLAQVLWPDSIEPQARRNLRKLLHELREQLPDLATCLHLDGEVLSWQEDVQLEVDVQRLERPAGRELPLPGLLQQLELYRGDLLPRSQEPWLIARRDQLRERFFQLTEQAIDRLEAVGDHARAIQLARRLLQHDRLYEPAYRHLMRLHRQQGERSEVVRVYQACIAVLNRELNTEPGAESRELYHRLMKNAAPPRLDRRRRCRWWAERSSSSSFATHGAGPPPPDPRSSPTAPSSTAPSSTAPSSTAPSSAAPSSAAPSSTISAVIAAQLSTLPRPVRDLAGMAAVIGRSFSYPVLVQTSELAPLEVLSALDELCQRGIIREVQADLYDFSHGKLREVAYAELSLTRRRLLHRRIAEVMEQLPPAQLDALSEEVAAHFEAAGQSEQAARYAIRAADRTRGLYACTRAVALYTRALELLSQHDGSELPWTAFSGRERAYKILTMRDQQQADLEHMTRALERAGRPTESHAALQKAHRALCQAEKGLASDADRQSYRRNVPANREILEAIASSR